MCWKWACASFLDNARLTFPPFFALSWVSPDCLHPADREEIEVLARRRIRIFPTCQNMLLTSGLCLDEPPALCVYITQSGGTPWTRRIQLRHCYKSRLSQCLYIMRHWRAEVFPAACRRDRAQLVPRCSATQEVAFNVTVRSPFYDPGNSLFFLCRSRYDSTVICSPRYLFYTNLWQDPYNMWCIGFGVRSQTPVGWSREYWRRGSATSKTLKNIPVILEIHTSVRRSSNYFVSSNDFTSTCMQLTGDWHRHCNAAGLSALRGCVLFT